MRSFGGTSSDKIDISSLGDAGTISAYSVFCAMRPASTSAGFYTAITLGGGPINWEVQLVRNGSNLEIYHQVQPSGLVFASDASGLSSGTLARAGGVWSGSTLKIYRDGTEKNSVAATTILQDTFDTFNSIGYQRADVSQYWNGELGEVAFWNAALTAAEMAALGAGVSPACIRPQSLFYYFPMIREVIDLRGIATPTVTGTTVADHVRVYRPWNLGTTGLTFPAATVPTIGRFVAPPAIDGAWHQYLEAESRPLAPALYLPVPPPPPPPPITPAPNLNPVRPPHDGGWQAVIEGWAGSMTPTLPGPLSTLPTDPLPQAGHAGKAFIPRDAKADTPTRQAIDRMREPLNSLMARGQLVRFDVRAEQWTIGGGITAPRAPLATDDVSTGALPGMFWINTSAQQAYVCIDNTLNAAVWKQVTLT